MRLSGRACRVCGTSLEGRRPDAKQCSGACRAAAARKRKLQRQKRDIVKELRQKITRDLTKDLDRRIREAVEEAMNA